jgi:hypothetical protein
VPLTAVWGHQLAMRTGVCPGLECKQESIDIQPSIVPLCRPANCKANDMCVAHAGKYGSLNQVPAIACTRVTVCSGLSTVYTLTLL